MSVKHVDKLSIIAITQQKSQNTIIAIPLLSTLAISKKNMKPVKREKNMYEASHTRVCVILNVFKIEIKMV